MCARNEHKINEKLKELPDNIQKKCLKADLGTITNIEEYRKIIKYEIGDLDIGVVCLNAGTAEPGHMNDLTNELIER